MCCVAEKRVAFFCAVKLNSNNRDQPFLKFLYLLSWLLFAASPASADEPDTVRSVLSVLAVGVETVLPTQAWVHGATARNYAREVLIPAQYQQGALRGTQCPVLPLG